VNRISSLDGLRALAIVLVLWGHGRRSLCAFFGVDESWLALFDFGHLGVEIFFVLSGFLITSLIRREWEQTGGLDLKAFYIRRSLRIFPAFYAFLSICAVLVAFRILRNSLADLFLAGTYLWNFRWLTASWNPNALTGSHTGQTWFLGHTWSLALEEQFYLVWPLSIVIFGLLRARWAALLVLFVSPFLRVATHFLLPDWRGHSGALLPLTMDGFMFGAAGALWARHGVIEQLNQNFRSVAYPVFCGVFLFVVSPFMEQTFRGLYTLGFRSTLNGGAILLCLLWLIRYSDHPVGRLFNSRLASYLATLSYSLYLWQQIFLTPYLNKTVTGMFPFNFLCCFGCALLSLHLVERPFLRWKERFARTPN